MPLLGKEVEEMSKKLLKLSMVLVVALLICYCLPKAEAAQSGSVAVKVTVTPSISVNIAETNLSFGSVAAGSTSVSTGAVTVTNDGSGVNETYSLSLGDPAGWTASQIAAGVETYILNAAFSSVASGISWDVTKHALSTTPVACIATKFNGDQTGVSVPYNGIRNLWFQFKAPTATAVTTEQNIAVTITVQAG